MANVIESRLWRYIQLVSHSTYFPMLVQGAAHRQGKPVTDRMIAYVASREVVLDAMEIRVGDAVDTLLERLMTQNGEAVDQVIQAAVDEYQESPTESETPPGP